MPMAAPMNSARSVAIATNSINTHMIHTTGRGKFSRHCSARFFPEAMPSLAESACRSMAIRLLPRITHRSS